MVMKDVLKIVESGYSINVKTDYNNPKKINSYIPVSKNLKTMDKILQEVLKKGSTSYMISGAYGTGKSYFTSVLAYILSNKFEINNIEAFVKSSENKYDITRTLQSFEDKNYLIVFPEDTISDFKQSMLVGIYRSIEENRLNIDLNTTYEIILEKLDNWRKNYPGVFEIYLEALKTRGLSDEKFQHDIKSHNINAKKIFKEIYSDLFAGEKFISLDSVRNIVEILEEFEKKVIETYKYDGVIYIFDEFGRYLESNIEKLDVKQIQDVSEYCNNKNNSAFLLITHKDIFQYTGKLSKKENLFEWEKVSGRFKKEHLSFEKTNMLEVISHILYKDKKQYLKLKNKKHIDFQQYSSYLKNSRLISQDPEEILDRYYPLNILTANILPDLSQKMAQNERTLFAFLCGDEEKSLKYLLETEEEFLVGLDKLYDYFEDNFRFLSSDSSEYKVYLNSKNALSKLDPKTSKGEIKFIKTLALIYIYNKYSEIEPNPDTMKLALSEDIDDIFEKLEEMNLVSFRRHYNHFKIVDKIDINVDKEVHKYLNESLTPFNYTQVLENFIPLKPFYPHKYNENYKITRYLGRYYLDISNISNLEEILSNELEDGKIVYLLNLENREDYLEIVNKIKDKDILIVYNYKNDNCEILPLLKELEAINRLYNGYPDKYQKDDIVKNEMMSYRNEVINAINELFSKYFSFESIKFSAPGEKNNFQINNKYKLIEVVSDYLKRKFPYYIPLNYELINKTKLSVPMRKARSEILEKFRNNSFKNFNLKSLDNYFEGSGSENTLARILVKKNRFLNNGEISFENFKDEQTGLDKNFLSLYHKLMKQMVNKTSIFSLIEEYCSNKGSYGFRRSFFMFILALISIKHSDEINYSDVEGNELAFSLDLLHSMEKNPKKYFVIYIKENLEKKEYFCELENIFSDFMMSIDGNKAINIFNSMKSYIYSLPRIATQYYSKEKKSFGRIVTGILKEKNATEFLLKTLPKRYKETNLKNVAKALKSDINFIDEKLNMLETNMENEIIELLNNESINLEDAFFSWRNNENSFDSDLKIWLSKYEYKDKRQFLKDISRFIKGFDYYNWYDIEDFQVFGNKLKEMFKPVEKNEAKTIIIDDKKLQISLDEKESPLGKVLKNKLKADIKNMGMTLSEEEKRKIIFEILLGI